MNLKFGPVHPVEDKDMGQYVILNLLFNFWVLILYGSLNLPFYLQGHDIS